MEKKYMAITSGALIPCWHFSHAAILLTALGLTCHKCLGTRENCTNHEQLRSSDETLCMEETRAPYGPISETLKRGCTTSHYCQSYFSVRRGFISQSIFCCSEDLCNIVPYNEVTYSTEHNGVECYSCISSLEECNETDMPSTQCRGKENHCVKISRQWLPDYVRRARIRAGCANQRLCQDTAFYGALMPKLPVSYMTCCQGPFCNREQGQGERRGKSALLALLAAPLLIALN